MLQTHVFIFAFICPFVELFKGKFFHCEGLHVRNITNRTECLQAGHRWVRRKYNFDNLGQVRRTSQLGSCPNTMIDRMTLTYVVLNHAGVDVTLRAVLQRRLGEHHV